MIKHYKMVLTKWTWRRYQRDHVQGSECLKAYAQATEHMAEAIQDIIKQSKTSKELNNNLNVFLQNRTEFVDHVREHWIENEAKIKELENSNGIAPTAF